jgi:small subunit ribosomal protein S17
MTKSTKTFIGTVSSDKADKTIVVNIVTRKTHPIYRKQYTSTKKFMAHDEKNEAHEGDKVAITETRPISARKRFTLTRVVERAPVRHVEVTDETIAEVAGQKPKKEATEETKETPKKEKAA